MSKEYDDKIGRMIALDTLKRNLMAYELDQLHLKNLDPIRKEIQDEIQKILDEEKKTPTPTMPCPSCEGSGMTRVAGTGHCFGSCSACNGKGKIEDTTIKPVSREE